MLILVFIITMALCAVLAVGQNSRVYESEQLDRVGYGDVTSWIIEQPGVEELIDQIEELRGTEKTGGRRSNRYCIRLEKNKRRITECLQSTNRKNYDYYIYNEDLTGIQKQKSKRAKRRRNVCIPIVYHDVWSRHRRFGRDPDRR